MDAYSLIPSKDVADYCKKIDYSINPIEIAWLIDSQDAVPIPQKNALFMELIQCYPDMKFHESVKFRGGSWLHEYLDALIKWNKGAVEFLHEIPKQTSNPYVYELSSGDRDKLGLPLVQYDSFEDAFLSVQPYWDTVRSFQTRNDRVRFIKQRKKETRNSHSFYMFADVNSQGELLRFSAGERLLLNGIRCPGELFELEIFLPVPFEPGDIVAARDGAPLLLKTLPQEEMSGMGSQYYYDNAHTPHYATFYFFTADGEFADSSPNLDSWTSPFSPSWGWRTSSLEYYKGELNGVYKYLPALSAYIKKVGIEQFMREVSYTARHNLRKTTDYEDTSEFFRMVVHNLEN